MPKTFKEIKYISLIVVFLLFLQGLSTNCYSVEPEEFLKDPQLELRARNLSKNIRCMVCQNQSIDDSTAPLAKDLRIIIRNKLTDGLTDEEVYKFLTNRYGEFILLKPPLKKSTYALWFLPFVFCIIGIFIIYWHNRKSKIIDNK